MGQEFRYYQCGDYFIPDIQLSPYKHKVLGKYGRMRSVYLQERTLMLLNDLILREQLFPHLWEIDETVHSRVERLMAELLKRNPAPNKTTYQMAWIQHMNKSESTSGRNCCGRDDLLLIPKSKYFLSDCPLGGRSFAVITIYESSKQRFLNHDFNYSARLKD